MRTMAQEIQIMSAIANEGGIKLTGLMQIFVQRAGTNVRELLEEKENAITNELRTNMRDTMYSNVDFALTPLQATQVANASLGAAQNGKAGIIVGEGNPAVEVYKPGDPPAPDFMASTVHSSPSGNYWRQWQGVYQNLLSGDEVLSGAILGQDYLNTDNEAFVGRYAIGTYAQVTLAQNDILTINWKITVG